MSENIIGIPVHGWSVALENTIHAIEEMKDSRIKNAIIVITNSGTQFCLPRIGNKKIIIIAVPDNYYWTASVDKIFEFALKYDVSNVFILNHDCVPAPNCLTNMLDFSKKQSKTIVHAAIAYKSSDIVWWAGNKLRPMRPYKWTYHNQPLSSLPLHPFETDSCMGQCLLLPASAMIREYLRIDIFPHYFSDSVFTSLLRRDGYRLIILPSAVSYTDQGDFEANREKIRADSWGGVYRALFATYSNRNIIGTYFSSVLHQDNKIFGIILGIYMVFGKTLKVLSERLGIIKRL